MSKYKDFETKKSVHINLTRDTHAAMRVKCFEQGLSMQEVIEEIVTRIIQGDAYMVKLLNSLEYHKRERVTKKLPDTDIKSIMRAIEEFDPHREE